MIEIDNTAHYLLRHALIEPEAVLEASLTIRCAARRNSNLRVERSDGTGYFIRQPAPGHEGEFATVEREARFYAYCEQTPDMAPLARYLPRLLSRDPVAKAHVVELIAASQSLDAYHRSHPASRFPLEPSRRLGEALGVLHRVFRWSQVVDDPDLAWLSGPMPWALQMHCPPLEILSHLSPAGLSLIGIVQGEPGLADRVGEAARSWQPDTVIHGDIKSENILVRQPTGPTGTPELTLVDWELVQVGDAAWDLAGALHDYLIFWTESMPMESAPAIDQMVKAARYPLESLRPAIRAFWAGYRSSAGLAQAEEARLLRRAVVDSAIRLMQSAEERAAERETLPAQAVLLLQISSNLLTDPARGQSVLYGLPTEFSS